VWRDRCRWLGAAAVGAALVLPRALPAARPAVRETDNARPEAQQAGPGAPAAADPLTGTLNDAVLPAYERTRAEMVAGARPVVLLVGDRMVLLQEGGRRSEAVVIPPIYHDLKAVAHIPFALYVLLVLRQDRSLDDNSLGELRHYREMLVAARGALGSRRFTAALLARQERIVAGSLVFLDQVLADRRVKRADLLAFARRMRPLLMANVTDAAKAQIEAMDRQMTIWRQQLAPAEWQRLRVVMTGAHMARQDNLAMQYFQRLLAEPREGKRIIYAESIFEEKPALDLLGSHLLEGSIGEDFFGDPGRMHRDLLADAAREIVREQLKQRPGGR
jgi:hypothetical protein